MNRWAHAPGMDAPPLATQGLTKIYGRRRTVHNVNLHVPQGALYALLGPNGAGKTTTLRCLLGLTRPTSGTCLVLGQDVRRPEARRQVAGMIDAPAFYPNLTPAENLRVVAELRGVPFRQALDTLGTVDLRGAAHRPARTFSLGMKQRLGIALALVGDPAILILDEPQNGLDPQGMLDMRTLLKDLQRRGHTVVVSSHLLGEVQQFADHVGIMRQSELVLQDTFQAFAGRAATHLELETPDGVTARQVLDRAGISAQVQGDRLLLPSTQDQAGVARLLLDAGLTWTRLAPSGTSLDRLYFDLTGDAA
ncbi:ABC transporter ATP-binding protein [Deinococcus radiopugnans ATCC 19172]|uniref:ABC transporter ATP-binding protein n=2 Tax=Deinococcus radiopugnans ATCC 19172 TaxID=585398 RepID=A0A5C4YB06_9DEIO|nr:ABC transporter ATP-binding protein [Deinococcus radiopugnans ATCC 19172]